MSRRRSRFNRRRSLSRSTPWSRRSRRASRRRSRSSGSAREGLRSAASCRSGHAQVVKIGEIEQPASFARALLIEALRRHGVRVAASPLGANNTSGLPARGEVIKLPKVAEYTSPPFSEYARVILKVSHNLHASTLPLLIAAHHGERTLEEGLKREGGILKSLGLEPGTMSFGGGAGGSRSDLATPRATVTLLRAMAARPEFAAFDAALPVLGRDGTLAKSVAADSPARGHAHAKTGTYFVENELDGTTVLTSKALAGYLETASGRSLVFAAFVNNVPLDAPKPNRSRFPTRQPRPADCWASFARRSTRIRATEPGEVKDKPSRGGA